MKIKTVWTTSNISFDEKVNQLLEEGWHLGKREVFLDAKDLDNSVLYAELVKLDPLPEVTEEPRPLDPIAALQALRDFCDARECIEDCQLYAFCTKHLPACEGPADWKLPGEEAAE